MLKMKLPMRTGEEGGGGGGGGAAVYLSEQLDLVENLPGGVGSSSRSAADDRLREPIAGRPAAAADPPRLDKETVFSWFGLRLDPAKRIEFMCGLLHMCQPLELRFLGSYLEDLARRDHHVLRDAEIRANSANGDMGILLTDDVIGDPVVRSKLLVCLSLLGSDSRECARVLFRILSHVDPALFYKNYGYPLPPFRDHRPFMDRRSEQHCGGSGGEAAAGGPLEQLALLFTMASLHPAFPFHQRETLRGQLDKVDLLLAKEEEDRRRHNELTLAAQATQQQKGQKTDYLSLGLGLGQHSASQAPGQSRRSSHTPPSRRATQREAVHIERIVLRSISRSRADREYNFEVQWSDSSSSSVTKTHLELENFLLKLPKEQSTESFERGILQLLSQGDKYESCDVEKSLRDRFMSAPPLFRQTRKVCSFFNCDSKPTCCRCNCQLGKAYQDDCSDASSQEDDAESYVQGPRKKIGSKSPSVGVSGAKGSKGETRKGVHSSDYNGQAERRKKSNVMKSSQEPGIQQFQDSEKRSSHPVGKKSWPMQATDRDKGKKAAACITNGSVAEGQPPQRRGLDTYGDTSSESYSSPSSPQHHAPGSLESEDERNKDTDSHSDDSSKGRDTFFPRTGENVAGEVTSTLPLSSNTPQPQVLCPDAHSNFTPLSFVHSLSYMFPNGTPEPLLPSQSVLPDGKSSYDTVMMQIPLPPIVPGPGASGDPEKREVHPAALRAFGAPALGLHAPGSSAVQPLVQRFKTASSPSPRAPDGTPVPPASQTPLQTPLGAVGVLQQPVYPTPDLASVGSGLPPPMPLVEPSHAKHPGLSLPSPYTMPPIPAIGVSVASGGIAASPGQVQAAVPPAVPTHTPGPAPSSSPPLTHSTARGDCTAYINSSTSATPITQQQQQQQQQQQTQQPTSQQQPMGCGACGCHNNCGSRGNGGGGGMGNSVASSTAAVSHAPFFFPGPQMAAAAARQMFGMPPALFQVSTYLTQPQPPHQANGAFFSNPPPAPPPPYGPLQHTHSHSHSPDVSSHMLGTQAAAVAAVAASYGLQQQMAPAAAFCQRFYQHMYPGGALGLLPQGGGAAASLGATGINKKNGNVSCYNCGGAGHYAQDCNQPSIDSTQQGGFRLKYARSHTSEALDNAD